jgi:hypothetical protein
MRICTAGWPWWQRRTSVNTWITTLLDRETRRVLKEHELAG